MTLRDILVVLDSGAASEGRLKLAGNIALDHGAYISAAFLHNDHPTDPLLAHASPRLGLTGALMIGSDIAEQQFRDHLRRLNIRGDWNLIASTDTTDLITLARAADLIIIGQAGPQARLASSLRPEQIVVACGRPVLVVPYVGSYAQVGCRVLVAWDGSREAARALNDSLPLIRAAEAVTLMTVRSRARDSKRGNESTRHVVKHLARHGIPASQYEALQSDISVSDLLLSRSFDLAADLIIAGAYHHSQLREAIIGGVSRELFHHMTLPVLMSH